MDNQKLSRILHSVTDSLTGFEGWWQLKYNDREMYVITDAVHDRMRIIAPVELAENVTTGQLEAAMIANFHSTLDVRYAISEEILWAAFIHPLSRLDEQQVRDGLLQVYRAAETFGTTYSSSELVFPGGKKGQAKDIHAKKKM
jgi:hypothetical protein